MALFSRFSDTKRVHADRFMSGQPKATLDRTGSTITAMPDMLGLQTTGTKRPFFFLHGDYKGGAFYCYKLAQDLGTEQPFYALEPCRLDTVEDLSSMENMAARHVQLLRNVQPAGPYLLGGFCNGALVAYEMARQLQKAGQQVDLLILMDPVPVAHLRSLCRTIQFCGRALRLKQEQCIYSFLWLQHAFNYLQHIYRYLFNPYYRELQSELNEEQIKQDGGIVQALKSLYELQLGQGYVATQRPKHEKKGKYFQHIKWHEIFPDACFPPLADLFRNWGYVFYWLAAEYVPGQYEGKSTFFFFRQSKGYRKRNRWLRLAKTIDRDVAVQILPGSEGTWKTTHLHDLSTWIHRCIHACSSAKDALVGQATPSTAN